MPKIIFSIILSLIFFLSALEARSSEILYSSFQGTRFIVAFAENELKALKSQGMTDLSIFIATSKNTNVEITPGNNRSTSISIAKNDVRRVVIDEFFEITEESGIVDNKQIEIVSDQPISIYAFSGFTRSSDSYSVLPVSSWGTEYKVITMGNDYYYLDSTNFHLDIFNTPRPGQFLLIADQNDTEVTIEFSADTEGIYKSGETHTITLDEGEIFSVKSDAIRAIGTNDLSGTTISSDKPIGVISSHVRTAVLQNLAKGSDSKDHVIEMNLPTSMWGRNYISGTFETSPQGDYFKIVALEDSTLVQYFNENGAGDIFIKDASDVQVINKINSETYWTSDKPIQIYQFMSRNGHIGEDEFYDPSMVGIPPLEFFINQSVFMTPGGITTNYNKYSEHYVSLIVDYKALIDIKLNGQLLQNTPGVSFHKITGTDYYSTKVQINPGTYKLESEFGQFSGTVFGMAINDSYAFLLGLTKIPNNVADNELPTLDIDTSCFNLEGRIFEINNETNSGIYQVDLNKFTQKNIEYSIDYSNIWLGEVRFTANVIDPYKDAYFELEYEDYRGNEGIYIYEHNAIRIDYDKDVMVDNLNWNSTSLINIPIKNDGEDDLLLNSIGISDGRFSLISPTELPIVILAGTGINIELLFDPQMDSSMVDATMLLDFDCDIEELVNIQAEVGAPLINAEGFNFGEVFLSDKICEDIYFVNDGNIDISLFNLNFIDNPHFSIDTLGIFPTTLGPNDTLFIEVCYSPQNRNIDELNIYAVNNFQIEVFATVFGEGVAPLVESIIYNWGEKRVGTSNPITLELNNSGNTDAIINFNEFLAQSQIDNNSDILSQLNEITIAENSSYQIVFDYQPITETNYEIIADYSTNWKNHPPLTITLLGNGIIPNLEVYDRYIGEFFIYEEVEGNAEILLSNGTEVLTIDKIEVNSGDTDQIFPFLEDLEDIKIEPGNVITIPVKYHPQEIGDHKIILDITHDANPNYARSVTQVEISASSIIPEDVAIEHELNSLTLNKCNKNLIFYKIFNNGVTKIELNGLSLLTSSENVQANFVNDINFPLTIAPNEEIEFPIEIYSESEFSEKVIIEAEFFDKIIKTTEAEINTQTNEIRIDLLDDIIYNPGDIYKVKFSGIFTSGVLKQLPFELRIQLDEQQLYLINDEVQILVKNNNSQTTYNAVFEQSPTEIKIISESQITVEEESNWEVRLDLAGMLDRDSETEIIANVEAGDCFIGGEMILNAKIADICQFNLRAIELIPSIVSTKIYPNPTDHQLNLNLQSSGNSVYSIYLTDLLGNSYKLEKNLQLNSGNHSLHFDIDLPSGVYFLHIENDYFNETNRFIVR